MTIALAEGAAISSDGLAPDDEIALTALAPRLSVEWPDGESGVARAEHLRLLSALDHRDELPHVEVDLRLRPNEDAHPVVERVRQQEVLPLRNDPADDSLAGAIQELLEWLFSDLSDERVCPPRVDREWTAVDTGPLTFTSQRVVRAGGADDRSMSVAYGRRSGHPDA